MLGTAKWIRSKYSKWLSGFSFVFTEGAQSPYALGMWYVNKVFDEENVTALPASGFTVRSSGGVVRIEKYGCGAELRRSNDATYRMTELPTIMIDGQFTLLWDAGYQKFLITHEEHKLPANRQQLTNLRKFNEELRTALGVPTYYNEAIGSTCHFSVYDRVKGRRGDVPDETVGVEESQEE
jgi:hypothetical protein